jgi:hypothetical protein
MPFMGTGVTAKKVKYIRQLGHHPIGVTEALRVAGLPTSLAREAESWEETILVRNEIRKALEDAGANAQYIAMKLKEHADNGSIRALIEMSKLRGYHDPIHPNRLPTPGRVSGGLESELRKRDLIIDFLGLRIYPVPKEAGAGEEGGDGQAGILPVEGAAEAGSIESEAGENESA